MKKCGICESALLPEPLVIENVPDSTFEINDNKTTLNLYECPICGAVQLCDVPLSQDYWVSKKSIGVSSGYREAKKKKLKDFIAKYHDYMDSFSELGCGDGQYIEILKELGLKVDGLSDIDQCPFEERYDCTFIFYYLEHMPYPKSCMEIVYEMTNPGGIVYIEVPNYDYIVSHGIWLEFTKDHRFYYSKRSMTYLLTSCGFEIEEIDNTTDDCLTVVARKPKDWITLDKMKERMEKDIKRFNEVTKSFGVYNVYGAGHHALMMLSRAEVKPQRIFDSNPAKVGSKVGKVVVEHGDSVNSVSMYEPIIIMCAGYNAEVKEKLTGKNIMEWR
jgi:hypothetical protein